MDDDQTLSEPSMAKPETPATAPPSTLQDLRRWLLKYRSALLLLWLPTALTAIYYLLIASDLYASQATFVVHSQTRAQISPLNSLLQTTGIGHAQNEVYSVNEFLVSRDAVKALQARLALRTLFSRPEADFFSRYPNPLFDRSEEDLFRYYQGKVKVAYDATTGLSTVTVKAFRAEDARTIANLLIEASESLVNRLNERARGNAVKDAETDVGLAQARVIEAQKRLLDYRSREALLDPGKSSIALFETVAKLKSELAAVQTRLAEIERSSPDSPLRSSLQGRVNALQSQINTEQGKMAGRSGSMAPKIPEYEQLTLQQEFAAKGLASAMASLESAREEARRQQVYLERVVEPNLPDKAEYPKRLKSILIVFISCFLAYSTGKLLLAGIREHSQL